MMETQMDGFPMPGIFGTNGQGETIEKAKNDLWQAGELVLEDRKTDIFRKRC